ncbi:MAG: thymidine kinase [Cyclobacteriaceae bacterium]|nr:thymidine kinase [Cyclobacteriaceae bacterium]
MFVEPNLGKVNKRDQLKSGWIEVITGAMFSGKTEELIRRLNRAIIARQKVEIFKPVIDTRYHPHFVVSHNESQIRSTPVQFANDILLLAEESEVIGIDEAQFFDDNLVNIANQLADKGKRLIIAGLDMDFQGKPFGPMPQLMAIAEFITKVHPICIRCGQIASYSHRLTTSDKTVMVGEMESYEPLCRSCYLDTKQ